jgi:pilus assembly protein CpaF
MREPMFTVVITEKSGDQKRLTFGEPEVTIGRVPGNDVVLPKGNVSKRHSRIVLKDNRFIVVDLKSTNGTYVNGRKITSPLVVKEGDKIYIGDFVLTLEGELHAADSMRPPVSRADMELMDHASGADGSAVPPLPSRAPEPMPDDGIPAVLRGTAHSMPPPSASHTSAPPAASSVSARGVPSIPPVIGGLDTVSERPPADPLEGGLGTPQDLDVRGPTREQNMAGSEALRTSASQPIGPGSRPRHTPPPARLAMAPGPPSLGGHSDLRLLMLRVGRELDLDDADPNALADERRWPKAERIIQGKLSELASENPTRFRDRAGLLRAALSEALGLGPLDALLSDPAVFHVVIERFDRLRADRGTGLEVDVHSSFSGPQAVLTCIRRLSAQAGLGGPLADSAELSLPNGLHVVTLLQGAASEGPVVSVRRRPGQLKSLIDLGQAGVLLAAQGSAIQDAVRHRRNVWLVGPASTELARLVGASLDVCPKEERVALFERAPEVALGARSAVCVRFGAVPVDILLERVRHFRPERLVFHQPSESELPAIVSKLALHHEGCIASLEQKSAKDALHALERAVGADLVVRSVSLLVELKRTPSGLCVGGIFEPSIDGSGLLTLRG